MVIEGDCIIRRNTIYPQFIVVEGNGGTYNLPATAFPKEVQNKVTAAKRFKIGKLYFLELEEIR